MCRKAESFDDQYSDFKQYAAEREAALDGRLRSQREQQAEQAWQLKLAQASCDNIALGGVFEALETESTLQILLASARLGVRIGFRAIGVLSAHDIHARRHSCYRNARERVYGP